MVFLLYQLKRLSEDILVKLKIDYVSFSVIMFVILFILRLTWFHAFMPDDQLVAKDAHLVISNEYINQNKNMYIEGDWLVKNNGSTTYLDLTKDDYQFHGTVTASMTIDLDHIQTEPISLHIPSVPYQTKVFINDVFLKEQSDKKGMSYQSYIATFTPNSDAFEIKLEIHSDFKPIEFPLTSKYIGISSEKGIDLTINLSNSFAFAIVGILIMIILSQVVFYLFINRIKLVLYLIGVFIFPTLAEIYRLALPYIEVIKLPFNLEAKLFTLSFFLSQFILLLLIKHLAGKHKIPYMNLIVLLYVLMFLVLLLIPVQFVNIASAYLIGFYVIWIVYSFAHVLRHTFISKYEMYSLLFIGLSAISGLIWVIIKAKTSYFIPFYPNDYIGIQLGFVGFWFNRFVQNSKTIAKNGKQKEAFLQQVAEQLSIPLNKLELDLDKHHSSTDDITIKNKLNTMSTTVRGMSFILNNWLDYSRLKSQRLQAQKQPVDIASTIRYVCDVMQESLKMPDLNMTVKIDKNIPVVIGDSKLLSQVLYNLIYFSLENIQSKLIYIECTQLTQAVIIHIEDGTKIGQNKYIWTTDTDIPIALQICDSIITEQGGNLKIKQNGFTLRLPIQTEEVERYKEQHEATEYIQSNHKITAQSHSSEGMSILAYSTEVNTLTTLQAILEDSGDHLTQVHTYQQFLEQYQHQGWDLIILESTLNDGSSLTILNMIRSRFNLIDLPVLMVLIPTSTNFISTYFEQGMNDYISRPIHPIELKYKIHTLLNSKRLVDQRLQLEASLLQNQVEPHFLFNTLNAIASLSKIDVDRMVMLLEQFGHYLSRGFKKRLLKRVIDLQDEIDIVKSYLYIEELRYEPYLKVEWDIEDVFEVNIPPYAIQTIVENAIKHGIRKKRHGGTIKITVKNKEEHVLITVSDDGVGMSPEKIESLYLNDSANGIGVYNTHMRLMRKFGQGLEIQSKEGEGTTVAIRLPYKKV